MENRIEAKGKSLEDAKKSAASILDVDVDSVLYEVVEQGSSGLFGIGAKPYVISAWKAEEIDLSINGGKEDKKEKKTEERKVECSKEDIKSGEDVAKEFLNKIFPLMNIEASLELSEREDGFDISVNGPNMGAVIGRRGETLDALQYLTSVIVNKDKNSYTRVNLDAENYRSRRAEALEKLANRVADKVVRNGRNWTLEPMNPFERRVIHSALQSNEKVTTYSIGEEPNRRIVVSLSK